jgi:hypothetical protein
MAVTLKLASCQPLHPAWETAGDLDTPEGIWYPSFGGLTAIIKEGTSRATTDIGDKGAVAAELAGSAVRVRCTRITLHSVVAIWSSAVIGGAAGTCRVAASLANPAVTVGRTGWCTETQRYNQPEFQLHIRDRRGSANNKGRVDPYCWQDSLTRSLEQLSWL